MVKFVDHVFCVCLSLVYPCLTQYVVQLGVFVDDLELYSEITRAIINTTHTQTFSLSTYYYNESTFLVLDDRYFTEDIVYGANATVGSVIISASQRDASSLCHVARWTNLSYFSTSLFTQSCKPTLFLQPSFYEYIDIALSLFRIGERGFMDVIVLLNSDYDYSYFYNENDTMYTIRIFNMNSTSLEPSISTDGTINRIVVLGTLSEITEVFDQVNKSLNARKDHWIVIPTDTFDCTIDTTFSYVCIVYSDNTTSVDVNQHLYVSYLSLIIGNIKTFVDNSLFTTETLNDYLQTTINTSNVSAMLNVIKFNDTDNGQTETKIGEWTRQYGLSTSSEAFSDITGNQLRVVAIHEPPFIFRTITSSGESVYEGYTIDILNEIATRMGFNYTIYYIPDGEYGILHSDGTWSGIIGEVSKGAADIGAGPISVTAERETVIDFSAPYYDFAGLQLLMRDPTVYNDMFAFASAFTGVVWITWFSIQISTAVILYIFHRLQLKTFAAVPQHNPFNFKECVWFVMGSITLAGADRSPITFSSRLLVAGFWFFCQIMMGTYTANLAAFMTSSRLSYSIESLEDLATQTSITYSVLKGTVSETYFQRMSNIEKNFYDLWKQMSYESKEVGNFAVWEYPLGEQYTKIWNAIQETGLIQNVDEGFEKLMSENFVYIHETPMIKYKMSKQCGLLTVGSPFSSKPYAFVMQQNSPLVDMVSKTILQMQSETIITELKDKWWKNSTVTCPTIQGNQGLSMEAVGGIFIVMAIGCGISFLILMIELSWNKYKAVKKNKITKIEANEDIALEEKHDLTITRKAEEDNLSMIDLNKYHLY